MIKILFIIFIINILFVLTNCSTFNSSSSCSSLNSSTSSISSSISNDFSMYNIDITGDISFIGRTNFSGTNYYMYSGINAYINTNYFEDLSLYIKLQLICSNTYEVIEISNGTYSNIIIVKGATGVGFPIIGLIALDFTNYGALERVSTNLVPGYFYKLRLIIQCLNYIESNTNNNIIDSEYFEY